MTVIIPTLAADSKFLECLRSLERQTSESFEVVIIDNSGESRVRAFGPPQGVKIIENRRNAGFGGAINQGIRASNSSFIVCLNDDTKADAGFIDELLKAMLKNPQIGMAAPQITISGRRQLDSAGMLIGGDGTSKQRAQGSDPVLLQTEDQALLPSGCAAIFRREMLDKVGLFDDAFFLYCEDTDLGLRARWAGWKCAYVPTAKVEHAYSHSAGRSSPLKAYLVERNRLRVLAKNFPVSRLWKAPFCTLARYFWHAVAMLTGKGAAGEFEHKGGIFVLAWFVVKAHLALLPALPGLLQQRAEIRRTAKLSTTEFCALLDTYAISSRQVAML